LPAAVAFNGTLSVGRKQFVIDTRKLTAVVTPSEEQKLLQRRQQWLSECQKISMNKGGDFMNSYSLFRVTTCLEKLEISGNLEHVREMSGKKSCHGKVSQNCSLLDEY